MYDEKEINRREIIDLHTEFRSVNRELCELYKEFSNVYTRIDKMLFRIEDVEVNLKALQKHCTNYNNEQDKRMNKLEENS